MNFGGQLESATSSDCPWGWAVNSCSTVPNGALHERQAVGAIDEFIQALPPID